MAIHHGITDGSIRALRAPCGFERETSTSGMPYGPVETAERLWGWLISAACLSVFHLRSGGDASEVGLFGKHGPGSLAKDVSGHVLTSVVHLVSLFQGTSATVVPICILFFFCHFFFCGFNGEYNILSRMKAKHIIFFCIITMEIMGKWYWTDSSALCNPTYRSDDKA